jgi:anhydro-N-acetylmuramic acid kinase
MSTESQYNVIGLMSGTSLDGLDIAFCRFELNHDEWSFRVIEAETIPYSEEWQTRLSNADSGSAFDLVKTDVEYGHFLGKRTKEFIERHRVRPDFIASHGHTIFHQPHKMITWQIGQGSAIMAETSLPVICDFRSADVAFGGQGAPLVPIGDRFLFPAYDYCLNLGGFANISFEKEKRRIAFDICPCNIVLNSLAGHLGKGYDEGGKLAMMGKPDESLIAELNVLKFYTSPPPKSLGKEWVVKEFLPILDKYNISVYDKMRSVTEHIAYQLNRVIRKEENTHVLITGGGAYNSFLIHRFTEISGIPVILPENEIINYKEALIFAFLGVLRWRCETNCLSSYTGASADNIGGAVYTFPAGKQ